MGISIVLKLKILIQIFISSLFKDSIRSNLQIRQILEGKTGYDETESNLNEIYTTRTKNVHIVQ